MDYLFHCDAELISRLDIIKKDSFLEYPYFKDVLEIIYPFDEIFLEWKLGEKRLVSRIDLKSKKLFICSSPDNPNIKERTTLLIRSQNIKNPLFHIVWEII